MKTAKILSCLLVFFLLLSLFPVTASAASDPAEALTVTEAKNSADGLSPAISNNYNGHNYGWNWSDPIDSVLAYEQGGYMRVEHTDDSVIVERYDPSFTLLSSKAIPMELPLFGGIYICEDYNFLVFGQTNHEEDNSKEVVRVVRYSKNWDRQAAASLCGGDTTIPFDAGSLRFARSGDMLYIRTAHEMYTSNDGLNHQSNLILSVTIDSMSSREPYSEITQIEPGYVSHSFNQFIQVDGTQLLAVDHGDAYPRAVVLFQYRGTAGQPELTGGVSRVYTLSIAGAVGDNTTGVEVGGFEYSSTHYLIAGITCDQSGDIDQSSAQQNLFITATPKNDFTEEATRIHYLTNFEEGSNIDISNPYLVKLGSDEFLLLWTVHSRLYGCKIDGTGEKTTNTFSLPAALSDCPPIVADGNITWYVTGDRSYEASVPVFYQLDLNMLNTLPEAVDPDHDHDYAVTETPATCTESAYTIRTCHLCGAELIQETSGPLGHEYIYDESASLEPTCSTDGITVYTCIRCSDSISQPHPTTGHFIHSQLVVTGATCTEPGIETKVCLDCGYTETTNVTPALGHDYLSNVSDPTCTDEGYTFHRCWQCGDTYTDSYIPATGHSFEPIDGGVMCSICWYVEYHINNVSRLFGSNRYETAFKVANALLDTWGFEKFPSIIVASGLEFPDALAGSYLAVVKQAPILLVNPRMCNQVKDYITDKLIPGGTVYLLGGPNAVPEEMETGLEGFQVKRLAGDNRYETNLAILNEAGVTSEPILVCTGTGFADSLSASATGLPILLVNPRGLTQIQKDFLAAAPRDLIIIGGESAVPAAIAEALTAYGTVERRAGANRNETSVVVAQMRFYRPESAVLAYAQNFPDGLCGGPLAFAMNAPLLLTATNRGPVVAAYAQENGIRSGIVLGGTGLIDDPTVRNVFSIPGDAQVVVK